MWKRTLMLALVVFVCWGGLEPVFASRATSCALNAPVLQQKMVWPVEGTVIKPWSLDCNSDQGHRGIDIEAPAGSSIRAAENGVVGFVGFTPAEGGGQTVTINHPQGLRSTYLHLTQATVVLGQNVARGQEIGTSAGPALHFGLKLGSRGGYLDPLEYLEENAPAAASKQPPPATPVPAPVSQPETPAAAPAAKPVTASAHPVASEPGRQPAGVPSAAGMQATAAGAAEETAPRGTQLHALQPGVHPVEDQELARGRATLTYPHPANRIPSAQAGNKIQVHYPGSRPGVEKPGTLHLVEIIAAVGIIIAAAAAATVGRDKRLAPVPETSAGHLR